MWTRLVRYVSQSGEIRYGDAISEDIDAAAEKGTLKVKVLSGLYDAVPTGEEEIAAKLLGPLTPKDVSIVRCIGLNYKTHIRELGMDLPKYPPLFVKPCTAVADTRAVIPIPKLAQEKVDYEGELTIVIGKDCKDVTPEEADGFILGYTIGNDMTARDWQFEKEKAGSMPQACFSKSFDKYAPMGPAIVKLDASKLDLKTYVNGSLRQHTNTSDMVFTVQEMVSFLSSGTTLLAGSVIMTGTPSGIGMMQKPPNFLKDGDEVSIEIEGIGRLVNTVKFK